MECIYFQQNEIWDKENLKDFQAKSVACLGERRDETTACRAALGERFLKGEARHLAKGG